MEGVLVSFLVFLVDILRTLGDNYMALRELGSLADYIRFSMY